MRLWYQVKGKDFVYNGEDDEPIDYFLTILPRMKHHALKTGSAARTVRPGKAAQPAIDCRHWPGVRRSACAVWPCMVRTRAACCTFHAPSCSHAMRAVLCCAVRVRMHDAPFPMNRAVQRTPGRAILCCSRAQCVALRCVGCER